MSRLFIDRPIFAWVLAIMTMLIGLGAMFTLPIAQYPDVAPPQVNIRANYPGASAATLEASVTQVLEQQLTGVDGLLYFSSSSTSRGNVSINVTFEKGTDPDIAQVQVQNQMQQALSRLPQQVQQQGLRVTKSNPDFLMIVTVYDETDTRSYDDVADYQNSYMLDPLARIPGVGDVNVFGAPYAMRIWLQPERLAGVGLEPADVVAAVQSQNSEVAAGEIGGRPQPTTAMLNAIVTAQSRLQTPEQFANILLKTLPDGSTVRVGDVARVEMGAEHYNQLNRINQHPGSAIAIMLAPGADALKTADLVKAKVAELSRSFPVGLKYEYVNDASDFVKLSIREVIYTLSEATILVVIVMFVFLQNWRATLVPAIAVPVVLLGTLAVFRFAGFSINTMTLFGMVLAIGLLVDDAIVVVENVERLLAENPDMSAKEATIRSMKEIQGALVAIALVLSAVFLPMAFFGGSTGVIYRQFSLTIVTAMVLSVLVALILSPALTTTLLRPAASQGGEGSRFARRFPRFAGRVKTARTRFNDWFARTTRRYVASISRVVDRKWTALGIYGVVILLLAVLFLRLPTGFLPAEDQGMLMVQYRLPSGSTLGRTMDVQREVEKYLFTYEKKNVKVLLTSAGGGQGPAGQNSGIAFMRLTDWDARRGAANSADGIATRAMAAFRGLRDAQVFALVPPAIRGLGQTAGFSMEMLNAGGLSYDAFLAARDRLLADANADPVLAAVRSNDLPDVATLNVHFDQHKLAALGLSNSDVNSTISIAWGGRYVNDFIDRGRVKRVFVQGDAPYRDDPQDLGAWFVRGRTGEMAPLSAFSNVSWATAPTSLARFNGVSAYQIQGQAAPGQSSGAAMARMEKLANAIPGVGVAWSGSSYQERLSSGQAPYLYAISLLVVFLCLAALYESWSVPVAVMLVVPLGLIGAVLFVALRGLTNDVYLQIGLITTMGLAAKNAILMIEFADQAERRGMRVIDAAIAAARQRLRPILMTSFAFMFGMMPLALSNGAGANSRVAIGTAVVGGMVTATLLAIFYIPLFYVLVRRTRRDAFVRLRARWQAWRTGAAA